MIVRILATLAATTYLIGLFSDKAVSPREKFKVMGISLLTLASVVFIMQ